MLYFCINFILSLTFLLPLHCHLIPIDPLNSRTPEGKNGKELNNPTTQIDEVVVVDVRESIKSLERRKHTSVESVVTAPSLAITSTAVHQQHSPTQTVSATSDDPVKDFQGSLSETIDPALVDHRCLLSSSSSSSSLNPYERARVYKGSCRNNHL